MSRIKIRRTNREELPGIAVLRDAVAASTPSLPTTMPLLDLDMDVDPQLAHLMGHDPDGFFTAIERGETLGFVAAHMRSRQFVLSELWVLPQHQGKGAGEALLTRALTYGDRSGAREFMAVVPVDNSIQSLLLRHEFTPVAPVYVFRMSIEKAQALGSALSRLLPGQIVTTDLMERRGQADLDRIDRLTRNIIREVDHVHWLKDRDHQAAFIRQGSRIAAYAYGGNKLTGPVAGATQEATLCGLGWALDLSLRQRPSSDLEVRVPAPFVPGVDALLDSGARLHSTLTLYVRGLNLNFDRCVLGSPGLP